MLRLLEAALAIAPRSGVIENDLAVAHTLRASLDERWDELPTALELLDSAYADGAPHLAVTFNRAFVLQCLSLWPDAQKAWRRLPQSSAITANEHQRRGGAAVPSPDPLALRRRGEWLLGEWGVHALRGEADASADLLREADTVAEELHRIGGDLLLGKAVALIRRAQSQNTLGSSTLRHLERGHAAFQSVRGDAIYSECLPKVLHYADEQLTAAGSPFAGWARLDQAVCAYFEKDFPQADRILLALSLAARHRGELALQGRAEWMLGLVRMVQGRFGEADQHYSAAITLFSHLGELAHAVYLRSLRAKNYEYGGAPRAAWRERLMALTLRTAVVEPERLFTMFEEAAQAVHSQGHPVASLSFVSEQMRAAEMAAKRTRKTDLLAFTLLARASLLGELGRPAEALADLDQAQKAWAQLPSSSESRRRLRIEIDLERSALPGSRSPAAAITSARRAMAFFSGRKRSLGDQLEVLDLRRLEARIALRNCDFAAARADLMLGLAEVERQRLEILGTEERARFMAQRRALMLDLVRIELDRFHDPVAALDAYERSTNRTLVDSLRERHHSMSTGALGQEITQLIRAHLDPEALVVRLGHLPDRLLIWTIHRGRIDLEQRFMRQSDFMLQIERCREALSQDGETTAPQEHRHTACDSIARTALPQSLGLLPSGSRLLVIPDELLEQLPFAALRTAPNTPFLVERFRLSYSPSLDLLARDRATASGAVSARPRTVLFVSDPAFSREFFPHLPRLESARRAVSTYASWYPYSRILNDRAATLPAVLKALDRFDIVQFDTHGVIDKQYPERGGVLLAPANPASESESSSLLTPQTLPRRSLQNVHLVILGACFTGLSTYPETAEATGLAAAFLSRGVPEILAAAWQVPDAGAARLLGVFHQRLSAGDPADEALRTAQLALLHAPTEGRFLVSTWAAFQLFSVSSCTLTTPYLS